MTADHTEQARVRIVEALNLPPLVPPQADNATLNVVNEAWAALSDLMRALAAAEQALEVPRQYDVLVSDWKDKADAAVARADALARRVETLRAGLGMIAVPTYPARYVETLDDGTQVYGSVEDARRFAQSMLDRDAALAGEEGADE